MPMAKHPSSSHKSAKSDVRTAALDQPQGVLITGASGRIGRAMGLAFAKAGWFVGVHYHQNKVGAEETLRHIERAGATGAVFQADIRDPQAVRQLVEAYDRQAKLPSVFVCNAGIAASRLLLRQREDEWANIIATNLTGTFHCLQAMAPSLLKQGGGSIIVIGSHAGFHGSIGQAAYAASKAGLIGLMKTAALEWGPDNIRVNLILPGWQETGLSEGAMPAAGQWRDHALCRPPALEETARTMLHVARLHDVSGQVWNCDSRNL
jgi:3-oxoacyl-[acyl-carrier protein] reductase